MDWVDPFYSAQLDWAPQLADDRDLSDLLWVFSELKAPPGRLLELGAGAGQFAAQAAARWQVVAVERVAALAALARARLSPPSEVIEGDFYAVDPPGPFDVIAYLDGFGIGTDADQQRLLERIAGWLAPEGAAIVEIYAPWFWARAAGREQRLGDRAMRRYGFDAAGCRMHDTWWPVHDPSAAKTQSLRCYSPADLQLLLAPTPLSLTATWPAGLASGGSPDADLLGSMSWFARLQRS